MRTLSLAQARRVALSAQGLDRGRLERPATMRDLQREVDRLGQFQIDSVNVLARAHTVPLFTRLGPYDTGLLTRAAGQSPRRLFEYWGHAASMIDVALEPALRWRMARYREGHPWGYEADPDLAERCLATVRERGPLTPRQIEDESPRRREHWGWNWSAVKQAMEWLHSSGQLAVVRRNDAFERVFDLPERVLPPAIAAAPTPTDDEAAQQLVARAARALGVATEGCLSDYFRLKRGTTRAAIAALAGQGLVEPVRVPGWSEQAWLWHQARQPRRVHARALVNPFDPLVFERTRAAGLFGLDYRIEIYVPEAKRVYGYYVLPFLLGERFVARVDLKADRATRRLLVRAAWREGEVDDQLVCDELVAELELMATWLGLDELVVEPRGDLAPTLARRARRS